ncbi:hypothetical protein CVIRNUC_010097 [Coccomyxa viridis]|uniref:DNA-directed DNA polymerase n=1 Tax=Coccomyxa viridis TaxID=1274662 RepID=A0AAV1ILQ0_9CHLO|nr:hypothetical protein CVIRNUC_010097 [Coccomyxa viridis]
MCRDHLRGLPVQVTPEKRGQAKQMAYGLLYGIGMHALAKSMEVTPDQAQQLSDSFRRRIPTLDKWLKGIVETCRRDRFITTIGGRRRYLTDIVSSDLRQRAAAERQAVNSAAQV